MVFFDPSEVVDTSPKFEALPPGLYRVQVIDTEYKDTKRGDGKYMGVAFEVLGGEHKNRRVFANFNLQNPSEKAQQIGRSEFKRFLAAIGITEAVKDTQEFYRRAANKTLWVDLTTREFNGKMTNDVVRYLSTAEGQAKLDQAKKASQPIASGGGDLDAIPF